MAEDLLSAQAGEPVHSGQVSSFVCPWTDIRACARKEALVPLRGAIRRDEQLAMWAFEAAVALGRARDQLGRERLLAVRADDFGRNVRCGEFGHAATVPGSLRLREERPVRIEGRTLWHRRIAARRAEVDQPEEALAVREPDSFPPCLRSQDARCPPVPGQSACVGRKQDDIDRAGGRAHVLLVLLQVSAQHCRRNHEGARAVQLRRFGRSRSLLQSRECLRPDNAKSPRIRPMVVRGPARHVEELVEDVGRNRIGAERLVRSARTDQVCERLHATDTSVAV
jgi:hypothetical protein